MKVRNITDSILDALDDTPVVLLNGARQTGKSTLTEMLAKRQPRQYISLDDPGYLSAARNDPKGFIEAIDKPVTLGWTSGNHHRQPIFPRRACRTI